MDDSFWRSRRVIVTGGTGFLGGRIAARLRDHAHVTIASRSTGVDLSDWPECRRFFESNPADIVFNCAAMQGGLRYNELVPAEIYVKNLLMGTFTMEAARLSGVKKYVNVVAGCSYPGYIDGDLSEDRYWAGPLHESVVNYGITKKVQTVQGWAYKRQYGFDSIHLVMTNLYGPGEHFEPDRSHALAALVRKFVDAIDSDVGAVEIWGTGRPVRDWMYVDDAAEAIILAAARYDDTAPLNIGGGVGYTIAELAQAIAAAVGFTGELVYDHSRPDGAMRKVFDTTKMREVLGGWTAPTPISEGIARTVAYYREHVRAAVPTRHG